MRIAGERYTKTQMERVPADRWACGYRQKTKEHLYLPISDEALKWLPERGDAKDSDYIYSLTHEGTVNDTLQHWTKTAKITKQISFHAGRHTHATMMLTLVADLYKVSKVLVNKNIAPTKIYAKIVDKKKEEAIDLIPNPKKNVHYLHVFSFCSYLLYLCLNGLYRRHLGVVE